MKGQSESFSDDGPRPLMNNSKVGEDLQGEFDNEVHNEDNYFSDVSDDADQ
jgi:hypothetical protein